MSGAAAAEKEEVDAGLDFGAWTPTGRKTVGPDSELIEVENPDGHKQTAIVYDKAWRDHHRLTTDVELVQSFMEFPMVEGIACLSRAPIGQGLFQYDTGSVLGLIEVLRAYRDKRKVVGAKAAVEMVKAVTEMLQEASENGPMQGIYSHGGITPWRIALDADGTVQLLGYGLPQMDMVARRENPKLKVRDVSFKYCPPERLTSGYEDISTDIYSLVLIAFEMITGDSLHKGNAKALEKSVKMGEAQALLMSNPQGFPSALHDAFVHALAFDPIGRYEHPWEFLQAVMAAEQQSKLEGESLAEVMATVRKTTRRGKALMDVGTAGGPRRAIAEGLGGRSTRMKSAAAAKPVRGRGRGRSQDSVAGGGRWGKVARSGADGDEEETTTRSSVAARPARRGRRGAAKEEEPTTPRRGRTRRGADSDDEETPTRRRRGAAKDESETPSRASRLRRSARTGDDDDDAPARPLRRSARTEQVEEAPKPTRSRSRRGAKKDEEAEPVSEAKPTRSRRTAKKTDEDAAEAKPTRSRRTAKKTDEDAAEAKPTRSRRTTKKTDEDTTPEEETAKPTRSRRTAKKSNEDTAEAKPTRSRRTAKKTDEDAAEAKPTRGRRTAKKTDEDTAEAKPTRSRSRRTAKKDQDTAPEEEAAKPTRSRSRRAAPKDDGDKPARSLRSSRTARSRSDDDEAPKPRASRSRRSKPADDDEAKPTRSRSRRTTKKE